MESVDRCLWGGGEEGIPMKGTPGVGGEDRNRCSSLAVQHAKCCVDVITPPEIKGLTRQIRGGGLQSSYFSPCSAEFYLANTPRYLRSPYCSTTPFSIFCLCYGCLPQSIVSSRSEYAPVVLLLPTSNHRTSFRPSEHAHVSCVPLPFLFLSLSLSLCFSSRRLTRRVYDRNSFTCSFPALQRNVASCQAYQGIKCAQGHGISDKIRISGPSTFVTLRFCIHRSTK